MGDYHDVQRQTLAALDDILRYPRSAKGRPKQLQREVRSLHSAGWSRA